MLRLAEVRLLASRWQIASVHRETRDLVLAYRSSRLIKKLVAERADPRLRIVDEKSAYYRLTPDDEAAEREAVRAVEGAVAGVSRGAVYCGDASEEVRG